MALPVTNETRYGADVELPVWRWREVLRALPRLGGSTVDLAALIAPVTSGPGDANRRVRIRVDPVQLAAIERAWALVEQGG